MKKTGNNKYVYEVNVDYRINDSSNITDIQKYLMKKHDIWKFFEVLKKFYIVLLITIVNASNHTKCISLSSQNV